MATTNSIPPTFTTIILIKGTTTAPMGQMPTSATATPNGSGKRENIILTSANSPRTKTSALRMCPKLHFPNRTLSPSITSNKPSSMNTNHRQGTIVSLITATGLLALASSTRATPYACDITNSAGTVSFRLNEAADNVKVISSGGAVTNDLGPGVKGLTVTNLGIAGGTIKVMVTRSAPAGYTQTSNDSFQDGNGIYVNKFEQARGIVVNKNPASATFGRIYIANGRVGTTLSPVRTTSDGIYLINSDDTVALDTGLTPRTAGLPFTTVADAASPLRLTIGKDDNLLYITDLSDPSGGLWVADFDVATNAIASNVFPISHNLRLG